MADKTFSPSILENIIDYVERYYPELLIDKNDFLFLETSRITTANRWEGSEYDINGWSSLHSIVKEFSCQESSPTKISPQLQEHIAKQIKDVLHIPASNNIRENIKNIWMARKNRHNLLIFNYPEWTFINVGIEPVSITTSIQLFEGKIYANFDKLLIEKIFQMNLSIITQISPFMMLNDEAGHITLINSDKVAKVPKESLNLFVDSFKAQIFHATVASIKHTISLDWPKFGPCVVLSFESPSLVEFISKWNETFPLAKTNPSLHTTIAVIYRTEKKV